MGYTRTSETSRRRPPVIRPAFPAQSISSSPGTIPNHPTNPKKLITAATKNATVKCPVMSMMTPVSHGAATPAKLPPEFWIPTQRPVA